MYDLKQAIPFLSEVSYRSPAAVASGQQNGREADGREIDKTEDQAVGRGARAPRTGRGPSAKPPEARLAGAHRPWARLGPRSDGDDSADGHVEADGVALAGPLSRGGRRRSSSGRHASARPRACGQGCGRIAGNRLRTRKKPQKRPNYHLTQNMDASRSRATRGSSSRSAMSWAFMSTRQTTPSCSRWTRSRKYRLWEARGGRFR